MLRNRLNAGTNLNNLKGDDEEKKKQVLDGAYGQEISQPKKKNKKKKIRVNWQLREKDPYLLMLSGWFLKSIEKEKVSGTYIT